LGFVLIAAGIPIVALAAMSLLAERPEGLGVRDGRLAECPSSPNCVSTQATDAQHRAEPIPFEGLPAEAMERLTRVVDSMPRTTIITAGDTYLHVEFRSLLFRFIDDVEFLIDPAAGVIHFRSASRAGYSDLGVNRRRMESIRAVFSESESEERPARH